MSHVTFSRIDFPVGFPEESNPDPAQNLLAFPRAVCCIAVDCNGSSKMYQVKNTSKRLHQQGSKNAYALLIAWTYVGYTRDVASEC